MKTNKKTEQMKNILYAAIAALILASVLLFLFQWADVVEKSNHPIEVKPVFRKKVTPEHSGMRVVDSLLKENIRHSAALKILKQELITAKKKSSVFQSSLQEMIAHAKTDFAVDTIDPGWHCDSMTQASNEVLQHAKHTDSLYESVIQNLEMQLINKDSLLIVKERLYQELKHSFKLVVESEQMLLKENKLLYKKQKQQNRRQRLKSAVLMVLTGFITYKTVRP